SHIDAESVIQFGILILIATPIMRVVLCIVGFARQQDRLYIAISTTVFIVLMFSFFCGGRLDAIYWLWCAPTHIPSIGARDDLHPHYLTGLGMPAFGTRA